MDQCDAAIGRAQRLSEMEPTCDRGRLTAVRRTTRLLATTALVIGLWGGVATTASAEQSVPGQLRAFRTEVTQVLDAKLTEYGDRLSPDERTRMTGLIAQVRRDLTTLQRVTDRAARLARTAPRSPAARSAARAAGTTFDASYAKALTSIDAVIPLLQPKLNLFEALQAKSQLDAQMAEYAQIGERIHALDASRR